MGFSYRPGEPGMLILGFFERRWTTKHLHCLYADIQGDFRISRSVCSKIFGLIDGGLLTVIRMLGSVQAASQCIGCHSVKRGTLLGAFSYILLRTPATNEIVQASLEQ